VNKRIIPYNRVDKQEIKRYSRQIILSEIGLQGQEKLKTSRVLIIGAGGLGCPILQYLSAAGVGHIGVVDDDQIEMSNLHRQILFNPQDIGRNKAITACEKIELLNPFTKTTAYPVRLTEENARELMRSYDLIIDGSDNFSTRYITNDTCLSLNKPFVFGSILKFEGQVSVFNFNGGPSYRDLFPEADEADNCEIAGVLNVLPGMIGMFMCNEALKVLCGFGDILSGKLLFIDARTNETQILQYAVPTPSAVPAASSKGLQIQELHFDTWVNETILTSTLYYLVDVREAYEHEEDPIGDINIPVHELPSRLTTLQNQKNVVFYCQSGNRSKIAAKLYKQENPESICYWMKHK
jgi:molybdopterin/thiamine biosynthesis adenylyltransferase